METMRAFTVALVALVLGAGILPAVADPEPTDGPEASGTPTTPTPTTAPDPQVYSIFNYPGVGLPDPAINTELVRLIDQTPAGAVVSASFFVVQPDYPVVGALLAAYARGVSVRVVLDSGDAQTPAMNQRVDAAFQQLALTLGTDTAAASFATQCLLACVSKEPDSINHNKFVTLSTSGDREDVVFQSTANLRSDGSGDAAWNAATVTSGNPGLYASYVGYFDDLAARLSVPGNDYHAARPPIPSGVSTPYYFARTDGTDSISSALRTVDCATAPTRVDVMASFFTRKTVRNRLNELAAAGCTVRVIARTDTINREFCDAMRPPLQIRLADRSSSTTVGIHAKYLTITGAFGDDPDAQVVWMGSHNLTRNALRRNDEVFLLIDDATLRAQFTTNFEKIWNHSSLTAGCDRAGSETSEQIEEEANTEVTPLIKEKQRVGRRLPKRLKRRTAIKSTRTLQGQRLRTTARCKVIGSANKFKKRKKCRITRPRANPTLVLRSKKRLRVTLTQTAKGSLVLQPYARSKKYVYRPRR
jgi:phosphatidylserine/phosphatidylglycerophosphate/cardiolipin synthase-like enzyme